MDRYALIKITVNLFAPDATISLTQAKWIDGWDQFHSNRIIFPVHATNNLYEIREQEAYVKRDFCHIRITPLDDIYNGILNSELDNLLTVTRLDYFLGNELARIANTALLKAPPYQQFKTFTSWMELWKFDPAKAQGQMVVEVTMNDILEMVISKTP